MSHLYLFVVILLFIVAVSGQNMPQWTIIERQENGLTIELNLPLPNIQEISTTQHQIILPYSRCLQMPGYPELPIVATLIQIPRCAEFQYKVIQTKTHTFNFVQPTIAKKIVQNDEGEWITVQVQAEKLPKIYPKFLIECGEPSIVRQVAVVPVRIYPARWNSQNKSLICVTKLQIRFTWDREFAPSPSNRDQDNTYSFLSSQILNYHGEESLPLDSLPPAQKMIPSDTQSTPSDTQSTPSDYQTYPDQISPNTQATSGTAIQVESGVRLTVTNKGWYRVRYDDLANILPAQESIDPQTFALICQGQEVAIKVVCQDITKWQSGDYLEFYGQPANTVYTGINIYWLTWGNMLGKRIISNPSAPNTNTPKLTSFESVLHWENNWTMWQNLPGPIEQERWFWTKLTAPVVNKNTFTVPDPIADTNAQLSVCMKGRSTPAPHPNHHTIFSWNDTEVGSDTFDNFLDHTATCTIPNTLLKSGLNDFSLSLPGDTGAPLDVIYLNWVELKYQRAFKAVTNALFFNITTEQTAKVEISNFTTSLIRIFDITDINNVQELQGFKVTSNGSTYTATMEQNFSGTRKFYAVNSALIKNPDSITFWASKHWNTPNHLAHYIIITTPELQSSAEPLLEFQRSLGKEVVVVMIEDLYNEYNCGLANPEVIRSFLDYAYHNWQAKPQYVLLLGNASSDYRNYLNGRKNNVPTYLSYTDVVGITPNDGWFACVDGTDELPDIMIGRIPALTPEQAVNAVNKSLASPNIQPAINGVFIADNQEADFTTISNYLITRIPQNSNVTKIYVGTYNNNLAKITADICAGFNNNPDIVNYIGHGATSYWTRQIFNTSHVATLQPANRYPLVMSWSCLTSYFVSPNSTCLSQELLLAPNKGASAVLSFSGAGSISDHAFLSSRLYSEMFEKQNFAWGPLWMSAKLESFAHQATESLRMFTLLGDPGTGLFKP